MKSSRNWFTVAMAVGAVATVAAGFYVLSGDSTPVAPTELPAQGGNVSTPRPPGGASSAALAGTPALTESAADETGLSGKSGAVTARYLSCFRITNPDDRRKEFLNLLDTMTTEEAPAVFDALQREGRRGVVPVGEMSLFWKMWAQKDQPAALAYLEGNSHQQWVANGFVDVLAHWVQGSPAAARRWIEEHEATPFYSQALVGFVMGYAQTDVKAATAFVLGNVDPRDRHAASVTNQIVHTVFAAGNAKGLMNWFDQLPSDESGTAFRRVAADLTFQRMRGQDLNLIADWTAAQSDKPWRKDEHLREVAGLMAANDPAAAMKWVTSKSPSARGHTVGVGSIVRQWAASNPAQLEGWLETVRGTPTFVQGARDYALAIHAKDPERAVHWANQVPDEKTRQNTLEELTHAKR